MYIQSYYLYVHIICMKQSYYLGQIKLNWAELGMRMLPTLSQLHERLILLYRPKPTRKKISPPPLSN